MAELRRELGLFEATVYGFGLIVGAGIYTIIGEAAGLAGESVVIAFALASVIALLTGLSYAELSARYPQAAGDYIYVRRAFGSAYLSALTALLRVSVGVIAAAAVALAFGGYFETVLDVAIVPIAVGLVAIMAAVNFWGIDFSVKVTIAFTAIETLGLLLIVWIGLGTWQTVDPFQLPSGGAGVVEATFLIFFAYVGFGSLVNVAEETRRATTAIPRAILLAIATTTVLYILVALSTVGVADPALLGRSASPLSDVTRVGRGPTAATAIATIALFSTGNTVLILMISTSRLIYGVSAAGSTLFPASLSRIYPRTNTPYLAIAAVALVTGAFTLLGDIGQVASFANLALLVDFVLVNAALLNLRRRSVGREPGFRVPGNIGWIPLPTLGGLLSSLGLIAFFAYRTIGGLL